MNWWINALFLPKNVLRFLWLLQESIKPVQPPQNIFAKLQLDLRFFRYHSICMLLFQMANERNADLTELWQNFFVAPSRTQLLELFQAISPLLISLFSQSIKGKIRSYCLRLLQYGRFLHWSFFTIRDHNYNWKLPVASSVSLHFERTALNIRTKINRLVCKFASEVVYLLIDSYNNQLDTTLLCVN